MTPQEMELEVMKVNYIIKLMEQDQVEEAIFLIGRYFEGLSNESKSLISYNVLFEAPKQYDMRAAILPESFYDFLVSEDSDELFFATEEIHKISDYDFLA